MNLEKLREYRSQILSLAQKYHCSNIRIFGSVSRAEATEESDVDFLVDATHEQDLFDFVHLTRSLEDLLGCKVDLVHSDALHPLLREQVLQEAVPL